MSSYPSILRADGTSFSPTPSSPTSKLNVIKSNEYYEYNYTYHVYDIILYNDDSPEWTHVKKYYVNNKHPFVSENSKQSQSIAKFTRELPVVNPMRRTFEHCGHPFTATHLSESYHPSLCNSNQHVSINIIQFNNPNDWYINIYNGLCVRECITSSTKQYMHTSLACHPIHDVEHEKQILNIDCVVIAAPWSDGFQHCTQDLLPRIVAIQDWLIENPNITLVCFKNHDLMWWLTTYFPQIKNNILFTTKPMITSTGKLYTVVQNPLHRCEMVPYGLYLNMNLTYTTGQDKHIVIFDRSRLQTRAIDSYKLANLIAEKVISHGYDIKIIDPSEISRSSLIKIMQNTKGVIAPHGGANYNVLFMRRTKKYQDLHRFFIEFITEFNSHHTYHIALGSNINYKAIICANSDHYKKEMVVDDQLVLNVLEEVL